MNGVKYLLRKAKAAIRAKMEKYFLGSLMISFDHERIMKLSQMAFEKAMVRHPELAAFGTVTSVGTASAATGFTWSGALAAVAFPFLWVISLFLTGHVYGMEFILSAPSLSARRWLVEQLLYCYSTAFVFSTGYISACILFSSLFGLENRHAVAAVLGVVLLGAFVALVYRVSVRYAELGKNDAATSPARERLGTMIQRWFIATSICLLLFIGVLWIFIALPQIRHCFHETRLSFAYLSIGVSVALTLVPLIFHTGSYALFQRCLDLSKDEQRFQATYRRVTETGLSSWLSHKIVLACVALLTLLPSFSQLFFHHRRPVYSSIEFTIFAVCWYWAYRQNTKTTYWGGLIRIAVVGAAILSVRLLLLWTIYE